MHLVRTTELNVVMKPSTLSRPAAARPVRKTMTVPAQLRVLMVEDIPTVALTMQAALLQAGMEVEVVATGAEALAAKDRFRPDIAC